MRITDAKRFAVIPARGGSRRIPRKNIRSFFGKPVIAYPIEAARLSGCFDTVVVSTDDDEIADVARSLGAEVLKRPAELARDEVGTQEVMRHAVRELVTTEAVLCCIYPACPLLSAYDLFCAAWIELAGPASFVVSVGTDPLRDIGWFYYGQAEAFMRHPLWGIRTRLYPVGLERAVDINTEDDWRRAEQMYAALHPEGAHG